MTETLLERGLNILKQIKENQSVIDYFLDNEGNIIASEQKSIDILFKFLKDSRNVSNDITKEKLAFNAINSIIKCITEENEKLKIDFKNL